METRTAAIFVTKLGAAERQLNAAIRMYLANEDELAVHTVAAAAYRVLRDIKKQRTGRSDSHDLFLLGLFSIANDLEKGIAKSLPEALNDPHSAAIVGSVRKGIRTGTIRSFEDITVLEDSGFWRKFNEPTNFLKHAEEDSEGALDLTTLKNQELLMRAASVLVQITKRPSTEMQDLIMRIENLRPQVSHV